MKKMSIEELKSLRDRKQQFALINVLSAEKFAQTRIPGALNIPLDDANFVLRVEQAAGGKDRTVVTYCASNECAASTKAAERLEAAGFTNVFDYKAGAEAWQESEKVIAANI